MTLAEMKQTLYNRIKNPLRSAECSSEGLELQCLYRSERTPVKGDTNIACFIGEFIPDNKYNPALEGLGVLNLISTSLGEYIVPEELKTFPTITIKNFLEDLQRIHDESDPNKWKQELDNWFARIDNLLT